MGLDPNGSFQVFNGQIYVISLDVIKDEKLWVQTPSLNFKIHEDRDHVYSSIIASYHLGKRKGSINTFGINKMKMKLAFAAHLS